MTFILQQIPHCKDRREHLPDHRRNSRAHHAPLEAEDENRVKDDVDDSARQRGDHGKLGVAVRADDGVHGLSEHIERNAQRNIEEVFLRMMKGLLIDRAAEHGNNAVRKKQIHRRQAQGCWQQISTTALPTLRLAFSTFVSAQRHADKGAAAVADHDGDGQCHHRQRENHGVGRVAIRAEIAGIGNKDLINNVVKRAHQQRDDAGDGVLPHEPARHAPSLKTDFLYP